MRRGGMPMSGINTPTGVTPSVSGEDGSALTASRDRADGDVQSAHTPRHPFSFAALPSHLGTGGDSAVAHDVLGTGTSAGGLEGGPTPKEEQLKIEPTDGFHGYGPPLMSHGACCERMTCMLGSPSAALVLPLTIPLAALGQGKAAGVAAPYPV